MRVMRVMGFKDSFHGTKNRYSDHGVVASRCA